MIRAATKSSGSCDSKVAVGKHYPNLDGLRAIALLTVLLHHYLHFAVTGTSLWSRVIQEVIFRGLLGVDLFFALSGFLITGILYDSKEKPRFFTRFYLNRSLRLFPAYFLFLGIFVLFVPRLFRGVGLLPFIFYYRNLLGPDLSDGVLGHLWSLSVEEQFYIFWAIAVYIAPRKTLPWVVLALCLSALAFRIWMLRSGYGDYDIYRFTLARMDGLLMGGLVAIVWRTVNHQRSRIVATWSAPLSALGYLGVTYGLGPHLGLVLGLSFSAIFFASVVLLCLGPNFRLLTSATLRHIGKYSYAMYLWHLLIFGAAIKYWHPANQKIFTLVVVVVGIGFSYGAARLSWALVEKRALRFKQH